MSTTIFKIEDMHCDGCAERIQRAISREPGVRAANVSFTEGMAEVRFNPLEVSEDKLRGIIETAGYHVTEQGE